MVRKMEALLKRLEEQESDLQGVLHGAISSRDPRGTPKRVERVAYKMQDVLEQIVMRSYLDAEKETR